MGIINFACTEQSFQGIVTGDKEPSEVDEEVASNVEEDKEEIDADEAKKGVDLGHRSLLFEVVEDRILG